MSYYWGMHRLLDFLGNGSRRLWWVLAFGVLGLAAASTILTFFLPLVLNEITTSKLAIGFAVGVEGVVALVVPLLVGHASDHTWNRFGRRVPYMLAATPLVAAGLILVALLGSYWALVSSVIIFFIGYYMYYTAYQSLYPDQLPDDEYGRAWASQSIFQGLGTGIALLAGGALVTAGLGLPFFFAAFLFVAVAGLSIWLIHEKPQPRHRNPSALYRALPNFYDRLRADAKLRAFLVAHFCWEFTLAAIRAFVILYIVEGLGIEGGQMVVVLAIVIFSYLVAAVTSGHIADRHDPRNYTAIIILTYAVALLLTGLVTNPVTLALLVPIGVFAGASVLMLSYPILLRVTPASRHGEYTGYYQFNRGLALLAGTAGTGWLIDKFGHFFPATQGLQILWLTTAVVAFASLVPFLRLTRRA